MAQRSFWKGYLKLSLVTCPVAMTPATSDSEHVRFHTLNRKTGNRLVSQYVDAETQEPLEEDEEAKGYQSGDDEYVLLEEDEIASVALESTRTIDIETFVDADAVSSAYYDKPHFLVPDDKVGEEAFSVIRDAMAATGKVGIARLVLYRRERAVLIKPRDAGLVVWTLRYGEELRDESEYFSGISLKKPDAKTLTLVETLIEQRTKPWAKKMIEDPVQDKLLEIISSRKSGKKRAAKPKEEAPATPSNVINIMDALRASISREGKSGGKGKGR